MNIDKDFKSINNGFSKFGVLFLLKEYAGKAFFAKL